ncbi:hypothetical protein [Raineya orbicola]|jgi:hypothetical protein|uniref:Uncharacterized protein n=1 Tax=Raineya orbicola TaxID=2016530 RepID=A0A2N3IH85_9BACT|nr:hypothetical protein [Raineya orbicola]PKQ69692.1 hypothetical protein Rain11_1255 [Raineya orbicola]
MFDVRDIKKSIDSKIVKKIFGNKTNANLFLQKLNLPKESNPYDKIVKIWNYEAHKGIIREMFKELPKFTSGIEGERSLQILLEEWEKLGLGEVKWPFSQGAFDEFVQKINGDNRFSRLQKDEQVKEAAVRYRRIKEINTVRNDFIETLLFLKHEDLIPTLSHTRGVDFFINGISYDQKVAKSPTNEFKKQYGNQWKRVALENPAEVAKYLYQYQDEGRFGASPRLFVVYLDEGITPVQIKHIIDKAPIRTPLEITFSYQHKSLGRITYKTFCFIILLTNDL